VVKKKKKRFSSKKRRRNLEPSKISSSLDQVSESDAEIKATINRMKNGMKVSDTGMMMEDQQQQSPSSSASEIII